MCVILFVGRCVFAVLRSFVCDDGIFSCVVLMFDYCHGAFLLLPLTTFATVDGVCVHVSCDGSRRLVRLCLRSLRCRLLLRGALVTTALWRFCGLSAHAANRSFERRFTQRLALLIRGLRSRFADRFVLSFGSHSFWRSCRRGARWLRGSRAQSAEAYFLSVGPQLHVLAPGPQHGLSALQRRRPVPLRARPLLREAACAFTVRRPAYLSRQSRPHSMHAGILGGISVVRQSVVLPS